MNPGSDRPGNTGRSLDRIRLKRSVDFLTTDDGAIHLLHDGLEQEWEIDQPKAADLTLLESLRSGFKSEDEIREELHRRGHETEAVASALADLESVGVLEREHGRHLLSVEESERFDRQLIYLADIAPMGQSSWQLQRRLRDSHVVVLGCGGLGSWAATGLVLAGVGQLTLVDSDVVELSNLNRQMLFQNTDIGRKKVKAASKALRALNPKVEINLVDRRVETSTEVAELVSGTDFLVMTADSPPYEIARFVNQACIATRTAWISAGQIPPTIRIGPTVVPGQTPCLECQERHFRGSFPDYETLIRHRIRHPAEASTLGPASGIIGSLIAMEAVHYLSGALEPSTAGQAMLMDLRTLQVDFESVESEPDCGCRSIL